MPYRKELRQDRENNGSVRIFLQAGYLGGKRDARAKARSNSQDISGASNEAVRKIINVLPTVKEADSSHVHPVTPTLARVLARSRQQHQHPCLRFLLCSIFSMVARQYNRRLEMTRVWQSIVTYDAQIHFNEQLLTADVYRHLPQTGRALEPTKIHCWCEQLCMVILNLQRQHVSNAQSPPSTVTKNVWDLLRKRRKGVILSLEIRDPPLDVREASLQPIVN